MSQETVRNYTETLTDAQKLFLFGFVHLSGHNLEISWDLDDVLMKTHLAVLNFVDHDLNTHYKGRRIKGWNSIANWLMADGIKTRDEAEVYENEVWTEPKILKEAPPNERIRAFSYAAWRRGIRQTVTTSRIPKLAATTEGQIRMYFPWLEGYVNQREAAVEGQSGEDYKALKISEMHRKNPSVVHLDDSMSAMRKILAAVPELDVIGFPSPEDNHTDLLGGRRIFFPEMPLFEGLLYYSYP